MKILSWLLVFLIASQGYAVCDWSKGITPGPNNTFVYSEACHQAAGQLVQASKNNAQALTDLNKALSLKDLSIQEADKRAQLWSDTSAKLEDRLQKVDNLEKKNEFVYFVAGMLVTSVVVYSAAKLVK